MNQMLVLDEIRSIQNNILKQFDLYCQKKGFSYCLWAGTLLGAIRHKGHIPWDDDVDIVMPREDYEKMLSDYANAPIEGVRLVSFQNTSTYYYPFAKLSDTNTEMKEENIIKQDYGVYVDIFPLDVLPLHHGKAKKVIKQCRLAFYLLFLRLQEKNKWDDSRAFINNVILKPISKLIPKKKFSMYIEQKIKNYEHEASKNLTVLTHSSLAKQGVEEKDVFPPVKTAFESMQLNVPNNYDRVLKILYGDYMIPPPVECQVAKHNTKGWRKENK